MSAPQASRKGEVPKVQAENEVIDQPQITAASASRPLSGV